MKKEKRMGFDTTVPEPIQKVWNNLQNAGTEEMRAEPITNRRGYFFIHGDCPSRNGKRVIGILQQAGADNIFTRKVYKVSAD